MSQLSPISGCDHHERRADVVFIHGLGGDAFTTWRHGSDESTSWPHWLGKQFPQVGVWSLGYAASPTRLAGLGRLIGRGTRDSGYSMPLPDRALEVLDRMVQKGLGERPLLLVCHSLGGLLAKQILRKSNDAVEADKRRIAGQTRAVLFLSTPHAGAALASLADAFRIVFGSTVSMEDLREHDAHLADLFDWYRNFAERSPIHTATYFEMRSVFGVLPIVNRTSAHPGTGADPVGLDEDHLSIAKPREPGALVCGAAAKLLRDCVLASPCTVAGIAPARIPRELPPMAYKLFGREAKRRHLAERLRAGLNTAVVGPAGLGKTALAAEALRDLAGSAFPDGTVYLDLYQFHGQIESAWNILANRLCGVEFLERRPARERAAEACRARRILVIIEGGEEADGGSGRGSVGELLSVLSPDNRWLLLTRLSTQSVAAESLYVREALHPNDAAALLDWLTKDQPLPVAVRTDVLDLLDGHPLALNWAGNLLATGDEDPGALAADWRSQPLLRLGDPKQAEHPLRWLYGRSVRGLDVSGQQTLAAAGLLAHAPVPLGAMVAALDVDVGRAREALHGLVRRGLLRREEGDRWHFTHVLGYRFARESDGSDTALCERLGQWLERELTKKDFAVPPGNLLEHAAALLRADISQRLWEPLARGLLYGISDRLEEIGRLDLVGRALGAVEEWLARLPKAKADESYWRSQYCVLVVDQGDVLLAQGDLAGALVLYRESLDIARRKAEADPSDADWQRELSVGQERVGDVLLDQGDLAGALVLYRESLDIRQREAEAHPGDTLWQRGLSVSQNKVGDVLRDQGDLAGALAMYRESLEVRRRLVEADPSTVVLRRELSVSQERVGDALCDQGDLAGALALYRESLEISRRLAETDPANTLWQRDVNVSQIKVGDVLRQQGDLAGALAMYRESLEVRRHLADTDTSNAVWQRGVGIGLERVGEVFRAQGDLAEALATFRESLVISRRLAEADPANAVWQRGLSFDLTRLAEIYERQGDRNAAAPYAKESLAIAERLAVLDRSNVTAQEDVAISRAMVARLGGSGE